MMEQRILSSLYVAAFALFFFFTGCLSVERSYPEKRYYIIDVPRRADVSPPETGAFLRIRKFRVSPLYEGKGFVYFKGNMGYESDFYNEFFISPGALLNEQVRQWLAGSGLFQYVVDSPSHVESTYILEGSVTALYGDYSESRSPKAVLEMRFYLIKDVSARSEIVFQKQYRQEIPLKGLSPEALVKGWNEALLKILIDFENDLREKALKAGS
ncbi:MAG: hypothetical protein JRG73_00850 [Deltaproteobacteria bacterium]|nr:hypothetical protein [Deltaproteobacteria bacterium]MBW2305453.1 hypothetical protein [Deltaproteobacteria bacterium]